jgi:hypothetical protein
MSNVNLVSTVLASTANYDLTDLATAKDELSLLTTDTSNDAWLARAISQVSRAVKNHTNRVYQPEFVQDWFDVRRRRYQVPIGVRTLQLSRWPVLAVTSVVISEIGEVPATLVLVENTDFLVDYDTGLLYRLDSDTSPSTLSAWEALPITVQYSAGYGAAVNETHSVPATPGPYVVTVSQDANFSCDQQVSYVSTGLPLTPIASGTPAVGQYVANNKTGQYTFAAADQAQSLNFAYCTEDVPDDLVDVTLQLVTTRFKARGRDPALIQRETPGIGTERFWFGGTPGQYGPFPPDIQALLDDNYKVPTVG